MDGKAYMDPDGFVKILKDNGFTEEDVKIRYNAIFHLVTTADGAEEFYTVENNKSRSEGLKEAKELDIKTYDAWSGHEKLYRFDNSTDFKIKIENLIEKVEKEIESVK